MKPLPDWATERFKDFLDHWYKNEEFLRLSQIGLNMIKTTPSILEGLLSSIEEGRPHVSDDMEDMRWDAELARAELERGFPGLYAQFITHIWGSFEELIRSLLAAWLRHGAPATTWDQIRNLKIHVDDANSLDEDGSFFIINSLEYKLGTRKRPGIGRFDALLGIFGASPKVEDDTRKALLELYYVRNILVHKRGLADRRFVEGCPWLGVSVGELVEVNEERAVHFCRALGEYITSLIHELSKLRHQAPEIT